MSLGINGIHELTSPCNTHIITVTQLQAKYSKVNAKCKIALDRLAALVNMAPEQELCTPTIQKIIASKNTEINTLAHYRRINNTHLGGLVNTHPNREQSQPTQILPEAGSQPRIIPSTQVVPLPQAHSTDHYRHALTGRRLRRTSGHPPQGSCPNTQATTNTTQTQSTDEPVSKRTRTNSSLIIAPTQTIHTPTQSTEEAVSKRTHSNYRLSIAPTQIIHTPTHESTAAFAAMTPTVQDSPAEGPPSKRTRSTLRNTPSSTPQSQNNTGANANNNAANWPSSQTSSLNTPDSCHTGNTPSLSACTQNTTRRATKAKSHRNSRGS